MANQQQLDLLKQGVATAWNTWREEHPDTPITLNGVDLSEANLGEVTLPQVLARHRDNKSCAGCHRRFDAIGLVFEGKLKVPQAGAYTFELQSTDGARLLVDGKTVLDRPGKGRQTATAKVELRGGLLPVRLEYFNTYDKPHLEVMWSGPGFERRERRVRGRA